MMTKSSARLSEWIERYSENPVGKVRRVSAVRKEVEVATRKGKTKRAQSPAQKAAFKKMRAGLKAKYGTTDISKMKTARRGSAKSRKPKKSTSARPPKRQEAQEQQEQEAMALEENPRKRRRRKKSGKKRRRTRRAENPRPRRRKKARRKATHRRKRKSTHRRRAHARRPARRRRRRENPRVRAYLRKPTVKAHKRRKAHRHRWTSYRSARRDNPTGMVPAGMSGSAYGGLLSNPMGAYSGRSLVAFGWAAGGIGIGLAVADFVDRYVATRKPADTKGGAKGLNPWYGRDAAAAMARRPDGARLAVQALGGVGALGLAYATRRNRVLPWLLGGVALGFGSNLAMKVITWWIMPKVLSVKDPTEATLANRLYPLEQKSVQDAVSGMFEAWDGVASLNAGQQQTPSIASPLSDTPSSDVYTLGEAGAPPLPGAAGHQGLNSQSGRVGACHSCGGMPGHYSNCPELCPDCPGGSGVPGSDDGGGGGGGGGDGGGGNNLCTWVVREGDDLLALVNEAGVSVNDVNALNGGGSPESYWQPGHRATLPRAVCLVVLKHGGGTPLIPKIPPGDLTLRTAQPTPTTTALLPRQPGSTPAMRQVTPSALPNIQGAVGDAANERRSMSFGADETEDE